MNEPRPLDGNSASGPNDAAAPSGSRAWPSEARPGHRRVGPPPRDAPTPAAIASVRGVPPMQRLFVGLFPEADVRAAIVVRRECWDWPPGSRWTAPPQLHLTLHFIGDVAPAAASALEEELARLTLPPFALLLRKEAVWRNGIAALLPDESAELRAWRAALASPLQRAGLASPETDWIPHLTLARKAAGARPPQAACRIRWPVRHAALVWSRPGSAERYVERVRFPARPAGPDAAVG
jgi:2'-5' RNA ligase